MRKEQFATIASHMTTNGEPQMHWQQVQSDDKTQFRVKLHHLGNQYVLKDKIGTCTWSHPDMVRKSATSNGPTCGERSIEWTVHMEDIARTSVLDTAQERVHPSPGWYSENKHILVKLSPASVSSPPMEEREWINEFICGLRDFRRARNE